MKFAVILICMAVFVAAEHEVPSAQNNSVQIGFSNMTSKTCITNESYATELDNHFLQVKNLVHNKLDLKYKWSNIFKLITVIVTVIIAISFGVCICRSSCQRKPAPAPQLVSQPLSHFSKSDVGTINSNHSCVELDTDVVESPKVKRTKSKLTVNNVRDNKGSRHTLYAEVPKRKL